MNQSLILNAEQELLQRSARDLFDAVAPVAVLRKLRDDGDQRKFSDELWRKMAELGWIGMVVPERYGGIGFGFSGLGVVMCEAGRSLSASPLLMTVAAGVTTLLQAGSEQLKKDLLPKMVAGECTMTLALEEGGHHQPYRAGVLAKHKGKECLLSGRKTFVVDGGFADYFVVSARPATAKSNDAGFALYLVDGTDPGISRHPLELIDNRNVAHIDFERCQATKLVAGTKGRIVLDFVLDATRTALAAEMLGAALESFERTVSYLREREQFDVKIGSFQALQHRAAQLYTELELTRSVVYDAMAHVERAWDTPTGEDRTATSVAATRAKIYANECYGRVSAESIQMHGGIGMTDEFEIGFFLKRMQVASRSFGDSNFLYSRYADLVSI